MGVDLESLPIGQKAPQVVNVVIEVPVGSRNKYEYDPQLGVLMLDRVLPGNIRYPTGYGFIPSTTAADGEPLDIMVAAYDPVFAGCVIRARVIGALQTYGGGETEHIVFALPQGDGRFDDLHEVEDMPDQNLRKVEQFYTAFKRLEGDENAEVRRWLGPEEAQGIISESVSAAS